MASKTSKSQPAAIGIVKSVEFDDRGAVLSFGDSSSTSTLVLDAEPNVRGAERRLKAFHDVYTVVVKADADDVSAELYGVNHNGEVNRPVPMADALGLWELGVPIRVERAAA
ncbi:MAG: hypothetical protein VYC56_08715 [Actinomycetota bacterium]|nr:hypothetical protein [Actinomycetota bacterium]MEC9395411.1 hypothetical protein [Actinomycetota bacterium]MED6327586.1 hypothetical protein [Actinomycetota bacterium]